MIEPELQRYYESRLAMMSGDAWNDLMVDVQKMYDVTNDLINVQDEKTLHFRRGELSIMSWILNLKNMSEIAYNQLKEDDENTP